MNRREVRILKRKFLIILLAMLILSVDIVYAAEPYNSYTYDYWGTPVPSPAPYIPVSIITGESLKTVDFVNPTDLFVFNDNQIYIVDSGNNRIVVLDQNFNIEKIIDSFNNF